MTTLYTPINTPTDLNFDSGLTHTKLNLDLDATGVMWEEKDSDVGEVVASEVLDEDDDVEDSRELSLRGGYRFTDEFRYDLAALGERGAVYACKPDASHAAHVLYKPYGTWASQYEWKYELGGGASVIGVAAGGSPVTDSLRNGLDIQNLGNVIVATSDGELIFLSGGGVERACISLPGTFVSMVAGSQWVFVVTEEGWTTSQSLMGRLINFDDVCLLQKDALPVPKDHTLTWIGITDEGAPAIYDSSGALNVMPRFKIPKKRFWNDGEFFVFVGVVDIFLTDTLRVMHETVLLHTLRDEICDEKSVQDLAERELELDNMLIKLILRACQSKQQGRALDFARLLCGSSAFDAAVRHAQNFGLNTLQKAIERLKVGHTGPSLELGANAASSGKRLADRGDDMVRKSSRHYDDNAGGVESGAKRRKSLHQNKDGTSRADFDTKHSKSQPSLLQAYKDAPTT
uniref:Alkyl sulphatase n=1 Tax=Ganoderma boninense TaxID=34458 RepID=A0A5K1JVT4_9APHY|nr:Alkyl sulphatase [Ganoderma boninense]